MAKKILKIEFVGLDTRLAHTVSYVFTRMKHNQYIVTKNREEADVILLDADTLGGKEFLAVNACEKPIVALSFSQQEKCTVTILKPVKPNDLLMAIDGAAKMADDKPSLLESTQTEEKDAGIISAPYQEAVSKRPFSQFLETPSSEYLKAISAAGKTVSHAQQDLSVQESLEPVVQESDQSKDKSISVKGMNDSSQGFTQQKEESDVEVNTQKGNVNPQIEKPLVSSAAIDKVEKKEAFSQPVSERDDQKITDSHKVDSSLNQEAPLLDNAIQLVAEAKNDIETEEVLMTPQIENSLLQAEIEPVVQKQEDIVIESVIQKQEETELKSIVKKQEEAGQIDQLMDTPAEQKQQALDPQGKQKDPELKLQAVSSSVDAKESFKEQPVQEKAQELVTEQKTKNVYVEHLNLLQASLQSIVDAPKLKEKLREDLKAELMAELGELERQALTAGQPKDSHAPKEPPAISLPPSRVNAICGYSNDYDLDDPSSLNKIYFGDEYYLCSLFAQKIKEAMQQSMLVLFKIEGYKIVFSPLNGIVLSNLPEVRLRALSLAPLHNPVNASLIETNRGIFSQADDVKESTLEMFMSQVVLWSARGKLPKKTNIDKAIDVLKTPNTSAIMPIPSAQKIAELWINKPGITLRQTVAELDLPQRYIFSFYSVAYFLGWVRI